jgi:hypothetical protein
MAESYITRKGGGGAPQPVVVKDINNSIYEFTNFIDYYDQNNSPVYVQELTLNNSSSSKNFLATNAIVGQQQTITIPFTNTPTLIPKDYIGSIAVGPDRVLFGGGVSNQIYTITKDMNIANLFTPLNESSHGGETFCVYANGFYFTYNTSNFISKAYRVNTSNSRLIERFGEWSLSGGPSGRERIFKFATGTTRHYYFNSSNGVGYIRDAFNNNTVGSIASSYNSLSVTGIANIEPDPFTSNLYLFSENSQSVFLISSSGSIQASSQLTVRRGADGMAVTNNSVFVIDVEGNASTNTVVRRFDKSLNWVQDISFRNPPDTGAAAGTDLIAINNKVYIERDRTFGGTRTYFEIFPTINTANKFETYRRGESRNRMLVFDPTSNGKIFYESNQSSTPLVKFTISNQIIGKR